MGEEEARGTFRRVRPSRPRVWSIHYDKPVAPLRLLPPVLHAWERGEGEERERGRREGRGAHSRKCVHHARKHVDLKAKNEKVIF